MRLPEDLLALLRRPSTCYVATTMPTRLPRSSARSCERWASGPGGRSGGAAVATRMALIGDDGPTGEFHTDDGGTYPW